MSGKLNAEVPAKTTDTFRPDFIDSGAFSRKTFANEWLVERCLVPDQPCVIGGPKKALKTTIALDLAISLGTGTRFLTQFRVPERRRVAVLSGESGRAALQDTARRICAAKGVPFDRKCGVSWSFRLPCLNRPADLQELGKHLRAHDIEVAILDPLYLCLLGELGASRQAISTRLARC